MQKAYYLILLEKIFFYITVCMTIPCVFSDGEEFVQQSKNMFNDMTLQNFERYTKEKDIMLVFYYMPWCRHSKNLQPEWEKASQVLEQKKQFVLGRVNCESSGKSLCEKFKISMYPDIRLYRHGLLQESYDGERTAADIIDYIQRAQSTVGSVDTAAPKTSGAAIAATPSPVAPMVAVPQPPVEQLTQQQQQQQFSTSQQTNTLTQPQAASANAIQLNAQVADLGGQISALPARPSAKDTAPSLMSLYEGVYQPKNTPVYQKFSQRSMELGKPIGNGDVILTTSKQQRKDAAIMNYVYNRHQQIKQTPEYQKLLPALGPKDIQQYYDWKNNNNQQKQMSEGEKQRRIGLGSFLLNPVKKRTVGKKSRINKHPHCFKNDHI